MLPIYKGKILNFKIFKINLKLVEVIAEALKKEEKVQLVGFGTFEVRHRAKRKGRNPQTNEEMIIPASKAPVFKAGKNLKEKVN